MKTFLKLRPTCVRRAPAVLFSLVLPLLASAVRPAAAQTVTVIDMIPKTLSAESNRDAEPNLTVDPAHPSKMAASAFTPDPGNTPGGVLFLSTDGGSHWALTPPVLSGSGTGPLNCTSAFCDITLRFGATSGKLYVSDLTSTDDEKIKFRVSRFKDIFGAAQPETLESRAGTTDNPPDQPYIQATTVLGGEGVDLDRVYVGLNDDEPGVGSKTATVDVSLNAVPPSPAGFSSARIEVRNTSGKDGSATRTAIHPSGWVYAAYYGWRTATTADVVVVRDERWGAGNAPFTALKDTNDQLAGQLVVKGITLAIGKLGGQRVGKSQISIAVDPNDRKTVYVAWADGPSGPGITLHLRHSTDGGQSWDLQDLRTITTATNPALAINSKSKVGFLYQQHFGPGNRWRTHVELSADGFATPPQDLLLADVSDDPGFSTGDNPIGDYDHLLAVGRDFYGVFSAHNFPDKANFPNGVVYRREVDFQSHTLFADANHSQTAFVSIDPFFFHIADLTVDQDFFVRDWTDGTGHDPGLEPSSHSNFYTTSDVWNRVTNTVGALSATTAPSHEGPHEASVGPNFAYVRVGRKGVAPAGSPDVTVTAQLLYSDYGLGHNYVDLSPAPSPTLVFGFGQKEMNLPNGGGVSWDLPADHSTHVCLAVQISTPTDPFVLPGLVNHAPGWPTTDLAVLHDNNKAQINILLAKAPKGAKAEHYPLVHNAATVKRDLLVDLDAAPEVLRQLGTVLVDLCGAEAVPFVPGTVLRIPGMEPGEQRAVHVTIPILPSAPDDVPLELDFTERVLGQPIDGFALAVVPETVDLTLQPNLVSQAAVLGRMDFLYAAPGAAEVVKRTRELLQSERISVADYLGLLQWESRLLGGIVAALPPAPSPCGPAPAGALDRFLGALSSGDAVAASATHAAFLEALDAAITLRQHAAGDPADILQTVRWGAELASRIPALQGLASAAAYVRDSEAFEAENGRSSRAAAEAYPRFLAISRTFFAEAARTLADVAPRLADEADALAALQPGGSPAAFQKAHRDFLLDLSHVER